MIRRSAAQSVTDPHPQPHSVIVAANPVLAGAQENHEPNATLRLEQLYDRYFDFVWRSLHRLGVSNSELEDAAHDVFLVVHRRIDSFEHRSTIKSWIFGIAIRVAKVYRQRRPRHKDRNVDAQEILVCSRGSPEEICAAEEAAELVQRILDGMDDEKRAVLILAELERMSGPEIAESLGIPLNTTYSRLRLARRAFEAGLLRLKAQERWRLP